MSWDDEFYEEYNDSLASEDSGYKPAESVDMNDKEGVCFIYRQGLDILN